MGRAGVGIRVAEARDVARIVELNCALFREDAGLRYPFTDQDWPGKEGERHFARLAARERGLCLLAESGGEVAGYLAGYVRVGTALRPVAVAELESMYVVEGYRGRGSGTSMVSEFLAWAGSQGAELASVTAYAANDRAVRFYGRNGFQPKSLSLERSVG